MNYSEKGLSICYRKDLVEDLTKKPTSALIIGETGLGKTTLLRALKQHYQMKRESHSKSILPIWLRPFGNISGSVDNLSPDIIAATISYAAEKKFALPRELKKLPGNFDQYFKLQRYFESNAFGFTTILFLDDIEQISVTSSADLTYSLLRVLLDNSSDTNPIFLIASGTSQLFHMEKNLFSLLRSRLQPYIYLGPLDQQEAYDMITDLSVKEPSRRIKSKIFNLTGGNPYLVIRLVKRAMELRSEPTISEIEIAARELIATDPKFTQWTQGLELKDLLTLLKYEDKVEFELAEIGLSAAKRFESAGIGKINMKRHSLTITCSLFISWLLANSRQKVAILEKPTAPAQDIHTIETLISDGLQKEIREKDPSKIKLKLVRDCVANLFKENGLEYQRGPEKSTDELLKTFPDFGFADISLAIEIKLLKTAQWKNSMLDEMMQENETYGKQFAYRLFVIYDVCGLIEDVNEISALLDDTPESYIICIRHNKT